jgi:hypothetical protein
VRPKIIKAIRALHRMTLIGTAGVRCRLRKSNAATHSAFQIIYRKTSRYIPQQWNSRNLMTLSVQYNFDGGYHGFR